MAAVEPKPRWNPEVEQAELTFGPERVEWSTDSVPPPARLGAWRQFIVDAFQECDMEYENTPDFWARMTYGQYGDIGVGQISGSRRKAVRTPERAKSGSDGVAMAIACGGAYSCSQARREMAIEAGEAYFFHNCLPGEFQTNEGSRYWLISIPERAIFPGFGDSSSLVGCRISGPRAELKLLSSYLQVVESTPGLQDRKTRAVIGSQILDLVTAAVGRGGEEIRAVANRGVRASRYRLVMEEIRRRYFEPTLNGDRLARSLGVSTRYLQQLCEENGRTLAAEITNERLRAVRRALGDRSHDNLNIADIAFGCGFSDLSHFNRAYRNKFGETPKATRGSASGRRELESPAAREKDAIGVD